MNATCNQPVNRTCLPQAGDHSHAQATSRPLWGARDARRVARPGTQSGRTAEAGFRDSRFPGSQARTTHRPRPSAAGWRRGSLEVWKPGNLAICRVHPSHPQSGGSMGTNDPFSPIGQIQTFARMQVVPLAELTDGKTGSGSEGECDAAEEREAHDGDRSANNREQSVAFEDREAEQHDP